MCKFGDGAVLRCLISLQLSKHLPLGAVSSAILHRGVSITLTTFCFLFLLSFLHFLVETLYVSRLFLFFENGGDKPCHSDLNTNTDFKTTDWIKSEFFLKNMYVHFKDVYEKYIKHMRNMRSYILLR